MILTQNMLKSLKKKVISIEANFWIRFSSGGGGEVLLMFDMMDMDNAFGTIEKSMSLAIFQEKPRPLLVIFPFFKSIFIAQIENKHN